MRLIDADKLMQDLADEMLAKALDMLNYDDVEYMIDRLASIPTAFDIDKVVEQLESLEPFHVDGYGDVMVNCDDVIDIVKAGGIDETRNI